MNEASNGFPAAHREMLLAYAVWQALSREKRMLEQWPAADPAHPWAIRHWVFVALSCHDARTSWEDRARAYCREHGYG